MSEWHIRADRSLASKVQRPEDIPRGGVLAFVIEKRPTTCGDFTLHFYELDRGLTAFKNTSSKEEAGEDLLLASLQGRLVAVGDEVGIQFAEVNQLGPSIDAKDARAFPYEVHLFLNEGRPRVPPIRLGAWRMILPSKEWKAERRFPDIGVRVNDEPWGSKATAYWPWNFYGPPVRVHVRDSGKGTDGKSKPAHNVFVVLLTFNPEETPDPFWYGVHVAYAYKGLLYFTHPRPFAERIEMKGTYPLRVRHLGSPVHGILDEEEISKVEHTEDLLVLSRSQIEALSKSLRPVRLDPRHDWYLAFAPGDPCEWQSSLPFESPDTWRCELKPMFELGYFRKLDLSRAGAEATIELDPHPYPHVLRKIRARADELKDAIAADMKRKEKCANLLHAIDLVTLHTTKWYQERRAAADRAWNEMEPNSSFWKDLSLFEWNRLNDLEERFIRKELIEPAQRQANEAVKQLASYQAETAPASDTLLATLFGDERIDALKPWIAVTAMPLPPIRTWNLLAYAYELLGLAGKDKETREKNHEWIDKGDVWKHAAREAAGGWHAVYVAKRWDTGIPLTPTGKGALNHPIWGQHRQNVHAIQRAIPPGGIETLNDPLLTQLKNDLFHATTSPRMFGDGTESGAALLERRYGVTFAWRDDGRPLLHSQEVQDHLNAVRHKLDVVRRGQATIEAQIPNFPPGMAPDERAARIRTIHENFQQRRLTAPEWQEFLELTGSPDFARRILIYGLLERELSLVGQIPQSPPRQLFTPEEVEWALNDLQKAKLVRLSRSQLRAAVQRGGIDLESLNRLTRNWTHPGYVRDATGFLLSGLALWIQLWNGLQRPEDILGVAAAGGWTLQAASTGLETFLLARHDLAMRWGARAKTMGSIGFAAGSIASLLDVYLSIAVYAQEGSGVLGDETWRPVLNGIAIGTSVVACGSFVAGAVGASLALGPVVLGTAVLGGVIQLIKWALSKNQEFEKTNTFFDYVKKNAGHCEVGKEPMETAASGYQEKLEMTATDTATFGELKSEIGSLCADVDPAIGDRIMRAMEETYNNRSVKDVADEYFRGDHLGGILGKLKQAGAPPIPIEPIEPKF